MAIRCVFQALNTPKLVFGRGGRGSAPDPAGGAYDAPPDPLYGWGGGLPSSILFDPRRLRVPRRLRRLDLGPSVLRHPNTNFWL